LLFTTQAQLVTAEHDTAIAEFNVAAAIGRLTAPELRLPIRLYDMDRHYQRGKGQVDRFCRRPQRVIPLSDRSTRAVLEIMARGQRRFVHDSLLEEAGFEPVWGFSCQVVVFVFLPVLYSELESRSSSRRLRSGWRSDDELRQGFLHSFSV
jgi:hypothetical protein